MYLGTANSYTYYSDDGQQRHTKGDFLIFAVPEDGRCAPSTLRACVRKVALEQTGHWMMGTARVGGESLTVSGSYGNNGLPMRVDREIWERFMTPVPERLYEAWNGGGGHNSTGAEREAVVAWAKGNLDALTPEGAGYSSTETA